MSPIELVLPMPPTLTNSGKGRSRHWRAQEAAKSDYWDKLNMLVAIGRIPEPPAEPLERVALYSVMHLGGEMDEDNSVARHKWVIDWLRWAGYIRNDRRKNLKWVSFPEQHVKRDGNYRIVLTLTPLSPSLE